MNNNMFGDSLENVLEKYGRDIVAAAKDGKIDPVIGRDDEQAETGHDGYDRTKGCEFFFTEFRN